jgi:hypothetical protein
MLPVIPVAGVSYVFLNTGASTGGFLSEIKTVGSNMDAAIFTVMFYMSLVIVLIISWLTVLKQNLYVASIVIMESNPGRSISGRSMLIAVLSTAAFIIAVIFLKVL